MVRKTSRERDFEAREAKLAHVREQVEAGELVIRQMTSAERARWDERSAASQARSTSAERASRAAALENRRKRAARFAVD